MPPPELARDAPGFDILEPVVIGLLARFRDDFGTAFADGVQSAGPTTGGGIDKPLIGQHRFDDHLRAVTEGLHDGFVFNLWDMRT